MLTAVVVYGHQPSASTQNMTAAGEVCSAIKEQVPEQKVLLIGGHVAALPERTLREEEADFVAGGEGFATLTALVEAVAKPLPALAKVPGLWYRDGDADSRQSRCAAGEQSRCGSSWQSGLGPFADDRNIAPTTGTAWAALIGSPMRPFIRRSAAPITVASAASRRPSVRESRPGAVRSANSYRYWSPEHVLDQIGLLVERYGIRNIKFADEMFVLNRKHVLAICEGIIRRKYDLESLGLCARRYRQGRHAWPPARRRLYLAGAGNRSRRWPRARRCR